MNISSKRTLIYIYIERERETDRDPSIYRRKCTHIYYQSPLDLHNFIQPEMTDEYKHVTEKIY